MKAHLPNISSLTRRLLAIASLPLIGLACLPTPTPTPPPTDAAIFEPDPNTNFGVDSGAVTINGIAGVTCFTTDGTAPEYNGGTCSGGSTQLLTGPILLDCGSDTGTGVLRTVKIEFAWPGSASNEVRSANFLLNCEVPATDTDGDGIVDGSDNCPNDPNADQADSDGDGIGDVCEVINVPDADGDGRPDSADNCVNVWNPNQGDEDGDGIGNVCDPTPQGPPVAVQLWSNDELAAAYDKWADKVRCNIRCTDPTGAGTWSWTCDNGGTATWKVTVNIFAGKATSTFTYANCEETVDISVHDYAVDPDFSDPGASKTQSVTLALNGVMTQVTNFSGTGNETGSTNITGGDFVGQVDSHKIITSKSVSGGYISVGCATDPIDEEICAPSGQLVNFNTPGLACSGGICPVPGSTNTLADTDGDGVFDLYDNCVSTANPTQTDSDFDGIGNACDVSDADGDGIADSNDNCPNAPNPTQTDTDGDGIGDACDTAATDTDSDGVPDTTDNCPTTPNANQADTDGDGIGDACDTPTGSWYTIKHFDILDTRCVTEATGDEVRTAVCNGSDAQQWELTKAGSIFTFRNKGSGRCIYNGYILIGVELATCDSSVAQQWTINTSEGVLQAHVKSQLENMCWWVGAGDVGGSLGNCLSGSDFGFYLNNGTTASDPNTD